MSIFAAVNEDNSEWTNEKIHITKNLDQFKILKGNREIVKSWVLKLKGLIEKNDLQVPILVDENMYILDGQHRVEAYKLLNYPVLYIIKHGWTLEDVREINSNQKSWKHFDVVKSYSENNYSDYTTLKWFVECYGFAVIPSIAMLNGKYYTSSKILTEFKQGHFKIDNLEWGKKQAERLLWLKDYTEHYKKRTFISAMLACFKAEKEENSFKWRTFQSQLKNNSMALKNQGSRNGFIINIEQIYNKRLSTDNKIRLDIYEN